MTLKELKKELEKYEDDSMVVKTDDWVDVLGLSVVNDGGRTCLILETPPYEVM